METIAQRNLRFFQACPFAVQPTRFRGQQQPEARLWAVSRKVSCYEVVFLGRPHRLYFAVKFAGFLPQCHVPFLAILWQEPVAKNDLHSFLCMTFSKSSHTILSNYCPIIVHPVSEWVSQTEVLFSYFLQPQLPFTISFAFQRALVCKNALLARCNREGRGNGRLHPLIICWCLFLSFSKKRCKAWIWKSIWLASNPSKSFVTKP